MRSVLDTNIVVSGLISPAGPPGRLLLAFTRDELDVVASPPMLNELVDVLGRRKFVGRIDPQTAARVVELFRNTRLFVRRLPAVDISPDPADNMVIATALAGQAEVIVTGDKSHLLALGQAAGVSIITAAEVVRRLEQRSP